MRGKNEFKRVLERRRRSRSCGQNADRNVDKTWTYDFCLCVVQHAGVVLERPYGQNNQCCLQTLMSTGQHLCPSFFFSIMGVSVCTSTIFCTNKVNN